MKIEGGIHKQLILKGIVQGVGFRPFVYQGANYFKLKGWTRNTSEGIVIDIEGKEEDVAAFIHQLKIQPPKLSSIHSMDIKQLSFVGYEKFEIRESKSNEHITIISPDIGLCQACYKDIHEESNRRYRYPFTNCTNCGPRFSIVQKLPYDRSTSTMNNFEMCEQCRKEYKDPTNRRFHAQPNACPNCGPTVTLVDIQGQRVLYHDPIQQTKTLLKEGKIVAIKGLGGFHLACNGKDNKTIERLRKRKLRPKKPLALMMKDLTTVKKYCLLTPKEQQVMESYRKPIVILDKKNDRLPYSIAPNQKTLGIMLPYTPLHTLLFDHELDVLVMTSANKSGMPMIYKNEEAVDGLKNLVDFLLLHNRDIVIPIDDSVCRVMLKEERVLRSGRGYAPLTLENHVKEDKIETEDTLALGAFYNNTFAISKKGHLFMSQHIGDMDSLEIYNQFQDNVEHFQKLYDIQPKVIAYDKHPNHLGSHYVVEKDVKKFVIQHHHAHIVSCMVDNNVKGDVIGIAYDGIGFGEDHKFWGGEFLHCNYKSFTRMGHLDEVAMPGGDAATKEPWKMAISYLYKTYGEQLFSFLPRRLKEKKIIPIVRMIEKEINSPKCTSMGRLFDAVAAIVGFTGKVTFQGEAALFLENLIKEVGVEGDSTEKSMYSYQIDYLEDNYVIDTNPFIKGILEDVKQNKDPAILSSKFHQTIVDLTVTMCEKIADKLGLNQVVLSGGVFQNKILMVGIFQALQRKGFTVFTHKRIPCNDGGISIGQLVIANHMVSNKEG